MTLNFPSNTKESFVVRSTEPHGAACTIKIHLWRHVVDNIHFAVLGKVDGEAGHLKESRTPLQHPEPVPMTVVHARDWAAVHVFDGQDQAVLAVSQGRISVEALKEEKMDNELVNPIVSFALLSNSNYIRTTISFRIPHLELFELLQHLVTRPPQIQASKLGPPSVSEGTEESSQEAPFHGVARRVERDLCM